MVWYVEGDLINFLDHLQQSKNPDPLHAISLVLHRCSSLALSLIGKLCFVVLPIELEGNNCGEIPNISLRWHFVHQHNCPMTPSLEMGTLNCNFSIFLNTFQVTWESWAQNSNIISFQFSFNMKDTFIKKHDWVEKRTIQLDISYAKC